MTVVTKKDMYTMCDEFFCDNVCLTKFYLCDGMGHCVDGKFWCSTK